MCGVTGILAYRDRIERASLERATRALAHRGPDGSGLWISPQERVGLGNTRLAVNGVSSGTQPLHNEDRSVTAVVNGEFYGYKAQRSRLESLGHRFRTRSDSELLLHLYEEYGLGCLQELRGEFAFILWDEYARLLVAARDRFGVKPLYYATHNHQLYLASEAKALLAAGVPQGWDTESFLQRFWFHVENDRSLFKNVKQVPPGHFLVSSLSDLKCVQYWDGALGSAELNANVPDEVLIEEVRRELTEAVTERLHAEVPVGVYLSGGIDSSALLGIAAQSATRPPPAFSLGFEGGVEDETSVAAETARAVGADFHHLQVSPRDLADCFGAAVWHAEAPYPNANTAAKYLLSRHARSKGIRVVLTGEGADEIFGGYAAFAHDAGDEPTVRPRAGGGPHPPDPRASDHRGGIAAMRRVLGFAPAFLEQYEQRGRELESLLRDDFRAAFAGRDAFHVFLSGFNWQKLTGRERLSVALYLWQKSVLPGGLLSSLGDRVEMAHGVEGRVPYLDTKVAEALARVPARLKINGSIEKYILREAAKPFVTAQVYRRKKQVFSADHHVRKDDFLQMISDTIHSKAFEVLPFYDPSAVRQALDELWRDPSAARRSRVVGALVFAASTSLLQQRFGL